MLRIYNPGTSIKVVSICKNMFIVSVTNKVTKSNMAQLYQVRCPKCGNHFEVKKGVDMNWDFSKPTPEDLLDETPFCCPYCKHTMCVIDEDFPDNVELTVFID